QRITVLCQCGAQFFLDATDVDPDRGVLNRQVDFGDVSELVLHVENHDLALMAWDVFDEITDLTTDLLQLGNRHAVPPLGVEQYFQSYGGSSDKGKILGDGKQFIGDLLDSLAILRPRAVLAQQSKLELQDEKVESLGGFLLLHGLHGEAGDVVA